ncbi:hypothetical protein [Nocardia sp. R7R-8]|uniref:hypothetical protein n=1 Tax=Nocardia sp. R7R-8 TaxID=3459304 RepID=UPI00403D919F
MIDPSPEQLEPIKLGSLLVDAISPENRLTDDEHALLNNRDRTPHEPLDFGE